MNRNIRSHVSVNYSRIWFDLVFSTAEMMWASAYVIAYRVGRMLIAGVTPGARDQREFTLMGQEKLEAAADSATAMTVYLTTMSSQLWAQLIEQWLETTKAMASSGTAFKALGHQDLIVRNMVKSRDTASRLSLSGVALAQHGLKPIHARATANARRHDVAGARARDLSRQYPSVRHRTDATLHCCHFALQRQLIRIAPWSLLYSNSSPKETRHAGIDRAYTICHGRQISPY